MNESAHGDQPGPTSMPLPPSQGAGGAASLDDAPLREQRYGSRSGRLAPSYTVFVPLVLFMASWLLWTGFQSVQLLRERGNLQTLYANQEQTVSTARQMRQQLDALAAGTKRLADAGHPNARALVQELAQRGIQINPERASTN